MKKLLSVLLASAMVLSLAACGGGDKPQGGQSSGQPSTGGQSSSQQSGSNTPADPMQELIDAAKAEGELVVYSQADNVRGAYYQGTGIGLALSKELISLHHGEIYAESPEGKGAIFMIDKIKI